MNKFLSILRRAPKRTTAALAILAAVIALPATIHAWGPSDRATYTFANPADHVTFNSITDNPSVGDERNFVRIKEDTTTSTYQDSTNLEPGKVYQVMVYYHNNAATSLNASGVGVAKGVTLKMEMPGVVKSGVNAAFTGSISATNATPGTVWDEAYGKNATSSDVALRYVADSAVVTSNGAVNGAKLPDSLFTTGTSLGYDSLNGVLPGCNQFAGYVTFKVRVDQPNFTVQKLESVDGKNWVKSVDAAAGSTIQYQVVYQNTGTTQLDNVVLRDILPTGVSYVAGSSFIANSVTGGKFQATVDGIAANGYNAGSYQPQGNVYLKFSAKLPSADALVCGVNTLNNIARATTSAGYKEDNATVTITKQCETTIQVCRLSDSTYPVTIKESEFDSSKYSKNAADCTKIIVCRLSDQTYPVTIKTSEFDSAKYSKTASDCNITVCRLSDKVYPVTIKGSEFDSAKYSKSSADCASTVTKLPTTGAGEILGSLMGVGALSYGGHAFMTSLKAKRK